MLAHFRDRRFQTDEDRLADQEGSARRRVLVAASCLRPPFTAPEVARVVERSVVEVVDALDQLRVRGLVRTRAVGAWTTLTLHIAVHRAARRLPERSGLHERARDLAVGPRERALLGSLGNHAAVLNRDLLRDETVLREVLEALVFALSTGNGRLLDYLVDFHAEKRDNEQFVEEKGLVIKAIERL